MLEALWFLIEVIGWTIETLVLSVLGWRFLLSPRYRQATIERWRTAGRSEAIADVAGAALGMATSAALLVWLAIEMMR